MAEYSKERSKELLAKRKYFREHPEEARKEYTKRDDGVRLVPVEKMPKENN
jgi:hypothetical protein